MEPFTLLPASLTPPAGYVTFFRFVRRHRVTTPITAVYVSPSSNRWNELGQPAVYASSSRALAEAEVLKSVSATILQAALVPILVHVPSELIQTLPDDQYPGDWNHNPHPTSTQTIGGGWLNAMRGLALRVRSERDPHQYNVIINPRHQDAVRILTCVDPNWPRR
ncbi:RES family NAD+ phosphorylase [Deinococcus depolymerans]|uniref:RES domain-containing protein n=1 Tax=Deinococcus depolymerans TaxID=392408 RepID=A0ABN1CBY8_9DEIO